MRIGLVAPSRWIEQETLHFLCQTLTQHALEPVLHLDPKIRYGALAGPDALRAQKLQEAIMDPGTDAVLAVRGGMGSHRLLPYLDFQLLQNFPKPLIGFSDFTALLIALSQKAQFPVFHGPTGRSLLSPSFSPQNIVDLKAALVGTLWHSPQDFSVDVLREGEAIAPLIGGNMSLLQILVGTEYDWSADGAILFLEDVDEELYKLDRMLWHFRHAGKFEHVKAVIFGEMVKIRDDIGDEKQLYGHTWQEIVEEVIPSHIPVCFNFPCGHGYYQTTLPLGTPMHIEIKAGRAVLQKYP